MKGIVVKMVLKKFLPSILIISGIFFFDRLSKFIILKLSEPTGQLEMSINSFLNFNLIWNKGIAFGLFSFNEGIFYNLVTLIIISITLVLVWFSQKSQGFEKICFLMIIGGSLGNLFDRINYSSVIDFIDISINNFHWFIFNVADIFISLGVCLLVFLEFLNLKKKS